MISNRELLKIMILDIIYHHQQKFRSGLVPESIYGADIISQLKIALTTNGRVVMKSEANVVYPILNELSGGEERILQSWWVGEGSTKKRQKRYYSFTDKGLQHFERLKLQYRQPLMDDKILLEKIIEDIFS